MPRPGPTNVAYELFHAAPSDRDSDRDAFLRGCTGEASRWTDRCIAGIAAKLDDLSELVGTAQSGNEGRRQRVRLLHGFYSVDEDDCIEWLFEQQERAGVVDPARHSRYKGFMLGNVDRFSGFAADYQSVRPRPPAALAELLLALSKTSRPTLVVDVGSGTGLSTRYWADAAERVVGVEPNDDMRVQAVDATTARNVEFVKGLSSATGLPSQEAEIVTCGQSLHWMEPAATFAEAARILRPGGVFAAFDFDWPPTTGVWEADQAYIDCMERLEELEAMESEKARVHKWAKEEHLARMAGSGRFRFTKEIVLHHTELGDAERFIGILLSQGGVRQLLKSGFTDHELGLDTFRRRCSELLGPKPRQWYWSARVRIGIR